MASGSRFCILRTEVDKTVLATEAPTATVSAAAVVEEGSGGSSGTTITVPSTTTSVIEENQGTQSSKGTTQPPLSTAVTNVANSTGERESDGANACFPPTATIELTEGRVILMADLQIGDRVRVAGGAYSTVFAFTHRDRTATASYVRFTTEFGASIRATPGHYLRVNGALSSAGAVRIGDELETTDGVPTRVTEIQRESGFGLYNPQTLDGEIVVDSILASTYTTAVAPAVAHPLLAPLRIAYRMFGIHTTAFDGGARDLADLLPQGNAALA